LQHTYRARVKEDIITIRARAKEDTNTIRARAKEDTNTIRTIMMTMTAVAIFGRERGIHVPVRARDTLFRKRVSLLVDIYKNTTAKECIGG
jgi:hypothetical protein